MLFAITNLFAQNNNYKDVDSLINTSSIIDAMNALKILNGKYIKDTIKSEYWIKYSKASYVAYKYNEAKESIDKAIKNDNKNSRAYFEKGSLYLNISEPENAIESLVKAVKIEPEGEYYYKRGIAYRQLKQSDSAMADYKMALSKFFVTPELYNNLAILQFEKEEYEDAFKTINKALYLKKDYAAAYSVRCNIRLALFDIDSACIDKNIAIEMGHNKLFYIPENICNGSNEEKLKFAAENFVLEKNYKLAINAYSKLIDSGIDSSSYYLNRGYCFFKLKQYEKAEKDYLKALSLPNPQKDLLYNNLSLLYYDQNKFDKSIEYSTKRIELNPNNHVPYIDRGLCFRKLKKYKEAENDFNKSLSIKPDFFQAFGYRACLYLDLGKYEKALDDAQKSITINPEYDYGHSALGWAKQQLGLPDFCVDFYNAQKYGDPDAEEIIKKYCK